MKRLLFLLFALSGFSGLIYESIWTHYLKLFLGHAAYAQTLVLAIFMGGMALGSWWCGARSVRWKNLLLGYALVEGVIGVAALVFHPLFDAYLQFAYTSLLPALGNPAAVTAVKWLTSALLILPQSILLGMTFPLMSGALIRRFPDAPGASVAMLYFTNSIGAAIGVLVSGFVLIDLAGLPGALGFAGALNIVLAALVWRLAQPADAEPRFAPALEAQTPDTTRRWFYFLLAVALLTGAASFIYEIVWIRMLSMVLGSSTHAFELMLSAFILGLALGGLWVRGRIDRLSNSVRFLGYMQLAMGALAALTLLIYNQTFDVMAWLVNTLTKDASGYLLFNLSSHAIAIAVMVPATFLAGTTLPLLTYSLFKRGYGEKSIGTVYAANTLGAIAGVFFATHLGLPLLGLKGLLITGAGLDIALGVVLMWFARDAAARKLPWITSAGAVACAAFVLVFGHLDLLKMSSGVYRTGRLSPENFKVLFHKDGKTATIDLVQATTDATHRNISIITNGKPDAAVNMAPNGPSSPDESTMILAGALPLAIHPQARTAAVIGMGSGLSTNSLLLSQRIERVDTIEIEAAVLEASQGFRPRVDLAYTDPRSMFHIDDAKTYFSTHNKRYDIILSEPSNPWVSGVASLFTDEFYAHITRHLAPNGIFVQWLQTYEVDVELVASVVKALSRHFPDYVIYAPNAVDTLFLARVDAPVNDALFANLPEPALRAELARIGVINQADLDLRKIGNMRALTPLFASYGIPANSDYFPIVDQRATYTRFLQTNAAGIITFRNASVPALEVLSATVPPRDDLRPTQYGMYERSVIAEVALRAQRFVLTGDEVYLTSLPPATITSVRYVRDTFITCTAAPSDPAWLEHLAALANIVIPQLSPRDALEVWTRIGTAPCSQSMAPLTHEWLLLWTALTRRDLPSTAQIAEHLLATSPGYSHMHTEYLLLCAMLGRVALGDAAAAQKSWATYAPVLYQARKPALVARLLAAHAWRGAPIPYLPSTP